MPCARRSCRPSDRRPWPPRQGCGELPAVPSLASTMRHACRSYRCAADRPWSSAYRPTNGVRSAHCRILGRCPMLDRDPCSAPSPPVPCYPSTTVRTYRLSASTWSIRINREAVSDQMIGPWHIEPGAPNLLAVSRPESGANPALDECTNVGKQHEMGDEQDFPTQRCMLGMLDGVGDHPAAGWRRIGWPLYLIFPTKTRPQWPQVIRPEQAKSCLLLRVVRRRYGTQRFCLRAARNLESAAVPI